MSAKPNFHAYSGDKEKLQKFLERQRFNTFSMFSIDKNGNHVFKLYWDYKPDSDWSKPEIKAIICLVGTGKMNDEDISRVATEVREILKERRV